MCARAAPKITKRGFWQLPVISLFGWKTALRAPQTLSTGPSTKTKIDIDISHVLVTSLTAALGHDVF
jgi:hypothetical protein